MKRIINLIKRFNIYNLMDMNMMNVQWIVWVGFGVASFLLLIFDQLDNNNIYLLNGTIIAFNKDKLSIDNIMSKYGSYDNYLKSVYNEVNDEFMDKYYPDLKEDLRFKILLSILNPILISNVSVVNKIYKQIILYNKLCMKFVVFSESINVDLSKELLREIKR